MEKDDNLEHKELVCTCQNESHVSSKGDGVSEINESSVLTKVAINHASGLRADRSEGCNDSADNLEVEELVCTCETAVAMTYIVDHAGQLELGNGNESFVSSSTRDELSETKEASTPTEVAIQASVAMRKISEGCNDIADDLINKELACTCDSAAVGSADVSKVENGNKSCASSFKGNEIPEKKESPTPIGVSLTQGSLLLADSHEDCNDSAHNPETGKLVFIYETTEELTVPVDSGDARKLENGNKVWTVGDGLSKNEEVSISTEVALVQASLSREDRIENWNAIIDNQKGKAKAKANFDEETKLYHGTGSNFGMRRRAPRYFDPPEYSQWPSYEQGGNEYQNKKRKRRKQNTCYICGDIGHKGPSCKHVTACSICLEKGHLINDCPHRNVEVDASTLCLRCGNEGHDMFTCNSDYSPDDLKHIQCYVCKDFGHLCCVDYKMDIPTEASCYKCGLPGHFGLDCAITEVPISLEHGTKVPIAKEQDSLCPMCRDSGMSKVGCRECKKARKRVKKKLEAAEDQNTFCSVCRESGGIKQGCRQCKKARKMARKKKLAAERAAAPGPAKVKKSRKNPHRMKNLMPMPAVTSYLSPFAVPWQPPPIYGPYYDRPGSNVWLSPAAAAARPAPMPPNPQMQPQFWNYPQPTFYQQTVFPVPQSQTQVPTGPSTYFMQFPCPYFSSKL